MNVVVDVNGQVVVDWDVGVLLFNWFEVFIQYYFIRGDIDCVFWYFVDYDLCSGYIYFVVEIEQVWCGGKYYIW